MNKPQPTRSLPLPPDKTSASEAAREPYEPPRVVTHGTLRDLTSNIGLQGSDGITGSRLF